jgi:hypothetical protein
MIDRDSRDGDAGNAHTVPTPVPTSDFASHGNAG